MNDPEILKLAALQIEPSVNLSDTFMQIEALLSQALSEEESLDCVALPEYAFGTFREWATSKQESDQLIARLQKGMGDLAKQHSVPIVAGSMPYQTKQNQWRNRCFVYSEEGKILGFYDKHHPFRAEKKLGLEPGTERPIFRIKHLRMAVLICSDLWYHDLVSQIAPQIDFLIVPTMTTVLDDQYIRYGQWAWQSLVSIRSKEYTIPIASADQASREYFPGVYTCGGSCIADPSYRFSNEEGPLTQALKTANDEKSQYITSTISLKAIREYARYRREVGLRE
ncbi:MAG: carbon-nitrogen hydrolase family protein [Promethearchaeota archaeon]